MKLAQDIIKTRSLNTCHLMTVSMFIYYRPTNTGRPSLDIYYGENGNFASTLYGPFGSGIGETRYNQILGTTCNQGSISPPTASPPSATPEESPTCKLTIIK